MVTNCRPVCSCVGRVYRAAASRALSRAGPVCTVDVEAGRWVRTERHDKESSVYRVWDVTGCIHQSRAARYEAVVTLYSGGGES